MTYHLPITPERIVRQQFENGLTVVLCENLASASVTLEGYLLAGGCFDQPGQDGLANMTASLLRHGSQKHSFQALNKMLDDVGAALNTSADDLHVSIRGRALADDLPLLLELLSEILLTPAFTEDEFSKTRGQWLTNLGIYEMDTGYRAGRAFSETLYPAGHPYARATLGTIASISSLTNQDVQRFYAAHYHPATCVLVLCGAIQPAQVLMELQNLFARWNTDAPCPTIDIPMVDPPAGISKVLVPLPEKSQVDLVWGTIGISRLDPDYYAARMADVILGRLGMMGRLGSRIREELGRVYYISSRLESGIGPVPWFISAGVNPAFVDQTVDELTRVVQELREQPVSDEELADCRSFLIGSVPIELETNADIAEQILAIEEFQLGYDYLLRYPDIINGVTKADIQRVVSEHLNPEQYVLALSGTL